MSGDVLVRLKYIRQERDGRLYVRRAGRSIRLHEQPGTDAFHEEYARALLETAKQPRPEIQTATGSLASLCKQYLASGDYRVLAPSSRVVRRRTLEALCAVHGGKPFALMCERHIRKIIEDKAATPEAANTTLKALRSMFKWAVREGITDTNPAKGVSKIRYKSDGFHPWTADEVAQYEQRWPN